MANVSDVAPLPELEKKTSKSGENVDVVDFEKASASTSDLEDEIIIEKAEDVAIQVISARDDPEVPILTFRLIFLGFGLSAFSAVLATIYTFKPQNASVSQLFCLIIAYVLGEAMATIIPNKGYWRYLNPGPFNIKEHTAIVIMASTASQVSTTMEVIAAMDLFYDLKLNAGVAMFQIFATQMIGYGVAGILRNFLVYPTYAFYPTYISVVNLLQSLHFEGTLNAKRRRFFWIAFAIIFCWEWIPQYPFPLLTAISIICLVDNGRHDFVRNLFGAGSSNEGIGLFSFGLSWTLITQGNPLVWPLQTQVNSYIGMALGYIVLTSCYYSNVFGGRDLKWMSSSLFNSEGETYDQSAVIDSNFHLNKTAVEMVGLPRYTTTYTISQLCYNLSLGSAITSVLLWNWAELKAAFGSMQFLKKGHSGVIDPHYEEMKKYPEVPQWIYATVFIVSISLAIGLGYAGPGGTVLIPAWSVILFSVMAIFFAIILGFICATTGFTFSIKYAVQIIAAFIHPGQPITVMYANLFGNASAFQTVYMLQDLKLGQYTKLPPRYTFAAQMTGSVLGSIFNYTMMQSIVSTNREVLKDPVGTRVWSGWIIQSLNSSSVAMGAFGQELFTYGKAYWLIPFAIFIGLLLPFPFWIVHRFSKPDSKLAHTMKYLNIPIITLYIGYLPYSVNGQWWSCVVIGFFSQWWLRTRRPKWFVKYNYLLSAALDGGSQVILFILSFAVFGASGKSVDFPFWWGNPEHLSADRCKST